MTNQTDHPLICEIHGPYVPALMCGRNCPECRRESFQQYDREGAIDHERYILQLANIPPRFYGCSFVSFECETQAQEETLAIARDYVENFPAHFRAGRCLTFSGRVGTGKTMLASIVIQMLIPSPHKPHAHRDDVYSAQYATAAEIIRRIRDTWGTSTKSTTVIEGYTRTGLLVMDEVGANVGTETERAQLFEILDLRYQASRPMIVISNCDIEGLKAALGPRAYDRLRDHDGLLCTFDWETWRKRGSAA